jgi:hypothetical protein
LAAAIGALAVGTAAFASGAALPVTLKLVGSPNRDVGETARLTATARLPAGTHLLIQAFPPGKAPAKVNECLRSPCTGTYRDVKAEAVGFQASAIKRAGKKVTTLGRSRRITISWSNPAPVTPPPTTPPAPAPAAAPGHYAGKTADNELFAFDITSDGVGLTNLQTGQLNESCDPPAYLSGGNINTKGPFPVALDGSFTITLQGSTTVSGNAGNYKTVITGRVSGGIASGTYRDDTSFTANGQGYSCTTGNQTWTASKTG